MWARISSVIQSNYVNESILSSDDQWLQDVWLLANKVDLLNEIQYDCEMNISKKIKISKREVFFEGHFIWHKSLLIEWCVYSSKLGLTVQR